MGKKKGRYPVGEQGLGKTEAGVAREAPKQGEGEAREKRKLAGVKGISRCEGGGKGEIDGHRVRDR